MKQESIIDIIKQKHYQVPSLLITNRQQLGIKGDALVVLIYLINQTEPILYNHKVIANILSLKDMEILSIIHELQESGLIKIELKTNKNNKKEEFINIDPLYEKILNLLNDKDNKLNQEDIYMSFEKEFARPLSPMEYEIINSWLQAKMDHDLIISALKEAVFNGVNNLRYIDKILYEWNKSGIKKTSDLKQKKPTIKKEELFDYNWLEE